MAVPFLRWAGSKRRLLSTLSAYWNPSFERYVEPFSGSACLFFHLAPAKAVLGDINSELIFAYRQVRDNLSNVLAKLHEWRGDKAQYLELRNVDPISLPDAKRAARFIYLNRYCFNGIYRTNAKGEFNVPFGGWRAGYIPPKEDFLACARLLLNAKLKVASFEKVLRGVRAGDFVYMDPPFSVSNRRVFREYDPSSFDLSKMEVLRAWLPKIDAIGAKFLVSYADSKEGRYLSTGYNVRRVSVRRNIAGFTGSRGRSYELLISN